MIDGFGGSFIEVHRLDTETAKRFPKAMTGRTLTMDEAALLDGRRYEATASSVDLSAQRITREKHPRFVLGRFVQARLVRAAGRALERRMHHVADIAEAAGREGRPWSMPARLADSDALKNQKLNPRLQRGTEGRRGTELTHARLNATCASRSRTPRPASRSPPPAGRIANAMVTARRAWLSGRISHRCRPGMACRMGFGGSRLSSA